MFRGLAGWVALLHPAYAVHAADTFLPRSIPARASRGSEDQLLLGRQFADHFATDVHTRSAHTCF